MSDATARYLRRRADYHAAKARKVGRGVACVHRLFATLYAQRASYIENATASSVPSREE